LSVVTIIVPSAGELAHSAVLIETGTLADPPGAIVGTGLTAVVIALVKALNLALAAVESVA
jgi:hypothetical protein